LGLCLLLAAALAGAEPAGYTGARVAAEELGLQYTAVPGGANKPPVAVSLSDAKHNVMLYADMMNVTVDGEVWSLTEPILAGEQDIMLPPTLRKRLAAYLNLRLPDAKQEAPASAPAEGPLKGRLVLIDPGHGGRDPGASGRTLREKDLVLDVGGRAAELLRGAGMDVVMTRQTDVFIELDDRVRIANRYNPDLFVSIHADAASDRSTNGTSVFYPDDRIGEGKSDITYRALLHAKAASVDPYAVGAPGNLSEAVEASVFGILLEEYRGRSRDAAERILRNVCRVANTESRGVKEADFRVVRYMRCPTVLVELDFISNPTVERRFQSPDYRDRLARGVADGIVSYLKNTAPQVGGRKP